jgi:hypothetical protein
MAATLALTVKLVRVSFAVAPAKPIAATPMTIEAATRAPALPALGEPTG